MISQQQIDQLVADRTAFVLFGPTASGKTALAIELAQLLKAEIINIDSRQLYQEMPIISAMPTAEEFAQAPHHLYEFLKPDQSFDVMQYLSKVKEKTEDIWQRGCLPIFVGGTGFYIKTLQEGMSPVPAVSFDVIEIYNKKVEDLGIAYFYEKLQEVDPTWAAQIEPTDKQRIIRGLAVHEKSGKPISYWQSLPQEGALNASFINIALQPERSILYNRINKRYEGMIETGLVAEMASLKSKGYSKDLPALTSIGIPEYFACLELDGDLQQAHEQVATKQRQYAKRQLTWLRNQFNSDIMLETPNIEDLIPQLEELIIKKNKG